MATSTRRTARKTAAPRKTAAARKTPDRAARRKASAPLAPDPTKPAAGARTVAKAGAPAKTAKKTQGGEPKKLKLVRDSFTLPKVEYGVIDILKTRAARLSRPAKKSEIVRAGLKALVGMSDAEFLACVSSLPPSKPKAKAKGSGRS